MASKILGIGIFLNGDGTTNPITLDLRDDPYFTFSPGLIAVTNDNFPAATLSFNVSPSFDIIKTPPAAFDLGSFGTLTGNVLFTVGSTAFTATLSGYVITITPTVAFTGVEQVLGILSF